MRALGGLLLGRGRLLGLALGPHADEIVEGAGVEGELAAVEMRDGVDAALEQPAVVADDDRGPGEALQPAFQPHGGLEVEVVGRLVEQQQFGLEEQHAGERHAHPPAAGELARRSRLRGGVEAEAGEDGRGAGGGAVGLDRDQAFVDLGHAVAVRVAVGLGEQGGAFCVGGQHGLDQGLVATGRFLGDMAHAGAGGEADLAAIGLDLVGDGLQQRRLAGAVAADEPDLAAGIDHEGGVVQQGAAGDAKRQVADGEDGHLGRV